MLRSSNIRDIVNRCRTRRKYIILI
uniref:Uncharacterized protein n=1 Tax=Lepeophtheirus salmonis TaxID=72036 RepID=A0A0K2UZI5_LEPSM